MENIKKLVMTLQKETFRIDKAKQTLDMLIKDGKIVVAYEEVINDYIIYKTDGTMEYMNLISGNEKVKVSTLQGKRIIEKDFLDFYGIKY